MNARTVMLATVVCAALLLSGRVVSQDKGTPGQATPEMQEMMKKWLEVASPGPHHERLAPFAGSWKTTTKIWLMGPKLEASVFEGRSTVKWVLDRRFLQEEFESETVMPQADGGMKKVPWEALGLMGYDNFQNLYVATWADSLGTQLLTMRGAMDPAGKTLTMYGRMDEPMLGVFGRTVKYKTEILSRDKRRLSIYDLHAGDDYKVIEVTYERADD